MGGLRGRAGRPVRPCDRRSSRFRSGSVPKPGRNRPATMDAAAARPGDRPVGRRECNGQGRCKRNGDGRSDKQDNDIRRDASGEQSASGRTAGRRKGGSRGRSDSRRAETISAKDEGIGKRPRITTDKRLPDQKNTSLRSGYSEPNRYIYRAVSFRSPLYTRERGERRSNPNYARR